MSSTAYTTSSSSSSSPRSFPALTSIPSPGQLVWFPYSIQVSPSSVIHEQENIGNPWSHPCVVRTIDSKTGVAIVYQMTSQDVVGRTNNWKWAQRYVPIAHPSDRPNTPRHPDGHRDEPTKLMPLLEIAKGGQTLAPSWINVESALSIEWNCLRQWPRSRAHVMLTVPSFSALQQKESDFAALVRRYPEIEQGKMRAAAASSAKRQLSSSPTVSPAPKRIQAAWRPRNQVQLPTPSLSPSPPHYAPKPALSTSAPAFRPAAEGGERKYCPPQRRGQENARPVRRISGAWRSRG